MRILPSIILTLVCWQLSCSSPALAGAMQSSRSETEVTIARNAIIADSSVKYVGYLAGETITVTLEYSASCNIVFKELAGAGQWGAGAGEIASVSGTPVPGLATNTGSVTFDLSFNTLEQTATGAQSGVARLNLFLGLDRDCDLTTGDLDGIDVQTTIPVEISVSTDSQED